MRVSRRVTVRRAAPCSVQRRFFAPFVTHTHEPQLGAEHHTMRGRAAWREGSRHAGGEMITTWEHNVEVNGTEGEGAVTTVGPVILPD